MDGLEVTKRIRALPGHRGRTPVVLVSADLVAIGRGASGQTGVDVCVMKPFTRGELLTAIATAARLTSVPDGCRPDGPVLDATAADSLKGSMNDTAILAQFEKAADRIAVLITLLEIPDPTENDVLGDAVHDLIGIAGILGLTALGTCLRRYDTAREKTAPAAALYDAATEALRTLRRAYTPAEATGPDA